MKINKRLQKYLVIALVVAMILPAASFMMGGIGSKRATEAADIKIKLSEEEEQTVNDISNMTGVPSEKIIKLKKSGKTWNEILDMLKGTSGTNGQDKADRSNLLAETSLGEDYVEKLKAEGYSNEEITEARMLVERIIYQLKEITDNSGDAVALPSLNGSDDKKGDDITAYRELLEKVDMKTAVYLMLKLNKDFGSIEKVLDEYLYSLQIGINLEVYLTDKDEYEKQKVEKGAGTSQSQIITIEKIEAKMLEVIQKRNEQNRKNIDASPGGIKETKTDNTVGKEELPPSPLPDVKNSRPQSPGEDVMKEINDIRDKALGQN